MVALAADDRVRGKERPTEGGFNKTPRPAFHRKVDGSGDPAMEHPTYGIDVVALTLAVVLAAAVVLIGSHLMHELADLVPPALSGAH